MRYKVKIRHSEGLNVARFWFVKRSNVVGFQLHREDGPATQFVRFYKYGSVTSSYAYIDNYYYLRGHKYKNRHTWKNALVYKSYSKNNKGMI